MLALYHDQGLIAVKTASFGAATNWTLGLPFLRTSVDHGTAFGLAGTGRADAAPLRARGRDDAGAPRAARGARGAALARDRRPRRRARMKRRIGILLVGVALGLLAAIGVKSVVVSTFDAADAAAQAGPRRPLGAPEYARRLAELAGAELTPEDLARRAAEIGEELELRLDARARELDRAAADWRPVFERLRDDAPASEAEVLALYRDEVGHAEAFFRRHAVVPMPAAPPEVVSIDNDVMRRLFPLALLLEDGTLGVTTRAPGAGAPDREDLANQCRVCVAPVVVHETYPGHHVAFAAMRGKREPRGAAAQPYFHEGWAQYAEILAAESGYWAGEPARELGALRLMRMRVLRAEADVALHTGAWDGDELLRRYRVVALVSGAAAEAELAGHLEAPGRKTAYFAGALQLLALRAKVGSPRGEQLLAFHSRLLERPAPLPRIARERFGVELTELPTRLTGGLGAP